MNRDEFRRLSELFDRAVVLPETERGPILEEAASHGPELHAKLESMLATAVGDDLDEFMEKHPHVVVGLRRAGVSAFGELEATGSDPPKTIGDFEIVRELGRGGMGVVYLARQRSLDRDVALKVLAAGALAGADALERFRREATLLGRVSHPSLIQVHTVGSDLGLHYIAMEYVVGEDLAALLRRRSIEGEELPSRFRAGFHRACTEAIRDVADGLAAGHEIGIVHRDVKPSNILIDREGRARLADFGLARDLADATLTTSGQMVGTTYYMSPERFREGRPTPSCDVYALGVVLYECLLGVRPFDGESVEQLIASILHDEPKPPRELDRDVARELETVIQKCLEKDPAHRYPDGAALRDDLTRFLEGRAVEAEPVGRVTRFLRRVRRRRIPVMATVVGALLATLLLIVLLIWGSMERRDRGRSERQGFRSALSAKLGVDDLQGAEVLLDTWIVAHPDDNEVRYDRADVALRQADWAGAADQFEVLARAASESTASIDRAAEAGLALARYAIDNTEVPTVDLAMPAASGREAFYRALIHQALGRIEEALAEATRAIELDPDLVEARYTVGALHYRLRDLDAAKAAFVRYRADRPGRIDLFLRMGQIELGQEDYEAARTDFEHFLSQDPEHAVARHSLAASYVGLARQAIEKGHADDFESWLKRAEDALARSWEVGPDYYMNAFTEAELRALQARFPEAEAMFARALQMGAALQHWNDDPFQIAMLHLRFAHSLNLWKQPALSDKARQHALKALRLQPDFADREQWAFVYARALYSCSRFPEALAAIDEALAGPLAGTASLVQLRAKIVSKM